MNFFERVHVASVKKLDFLTWIDQMRVCHGLVITPDPRPFPGITVESF